MDEYTSRHRGSERRTESRVSGRSVREREYTRAPEPTTSRHHSRPRVEEVFPEATNGRNHRAHVSRSRRPSRAKEREEPSFIAETSFVRAPLNSRVDPSTSKPKGKGKAKEESLDHLPVEVQEALILEDLLYALMGIEGTYVTYPPNHSQEEHDPMQGVHFVVSSSLDMSLRDLVERVLPLGTYYTAISSFVELRSHLDFGLVNHALCAAIREMLKDYQTLITQLEHAYNSSPQFSLQKLWFYVHPTVHTLSLLYQLTTQLATADATPEAASSSSGGEDDDDDAETRAKNEALGLGGAALKAVLSEINSADANQIPVKGGEVLSILHERAQHLAGDPAARALYGALLRAGGKPYVGVLRVWAATGRLVDPYEEVCVKESKFIHRGTLEQDYIDEYWERRYTLRDGSTLAGPAKRQLGVPPPRAVGGLLPGGACIPPLLEGWKHKILLAGKYLNVIRECGIEVVADPKHTADEEISMEDEKLYKFIEDAYAHANRTLLQLLLVDQNLLPRLRMLKRVFFTAHGAYLTHLLDLAHGELRKSARAASLVKLQSLLDLCLGADGHADDAPFREDVRVTMASSGLYEWLLKVVDQDAGINVGAAPMLGGSTAVDGGQEERKDKEEKKQMLAIDALALDYSVKFPLSLVFSRKALLRYQLLFRFLLHLTHVEQALGAMWVEQKAGPWRRAARALPASMKTGANGQRDGESGEGGEFGKWRLRVCVLRARMIAFVQQIRAFVTHEVLEPNWRVLEEKLGRARTVDALLRDHVDFLDTCLKECMLTSSKLLKAYARLIVTCSTFALYTASFTKSANQALAAAETPEGDTSMAKRWEFLGKFETNFNYWFGVHLDYVKLHASSENVALLPLVVRLSTIKQG